MRCGPREEAAREQLECLDDGFEIGAEAVGDIAQEHPRIVRKLAEQGGTLVAQAQRRLAAVVGEAAAHHQSPIDQLDDQPAGGRHRDAESTGKLAGGGARMAPQVVQHPELGQRHMRALPLPQPNRVGLAEGAPERLAEPGLERIVVHNRDYTALPYYL